MDENAPPFPEEFEQQVRNCLQHLYDMTELQQLPLVRQLLPDTPALQRGQAFRRLIFKLLEAHGSGHQSRIAPGSCLPDFDAALRRRASESRGQPAVGPQRAPVLPRAQSRPASDHLSAVGAGQRAACRPEISVQSELQRVPPAPSPRPSIRRICVRAWSKRRRVSRRRAGFAMNVHLPDQYPELNFNAQAARQLLIMFLYQVIQRQTAHDDAGH